MAKSIKTNSATQTSLKKNQLFIFLGGNNFWEGLFDTINLSLIQTIVKHNIIDCSNILMTTIIPRRMPKGKYPILIAKEEKLRKILLDHGTNIFFYHIPGRTLRGLFCALKNIRRLVLGFDERFIWSQNYFNCLIGILLKQQLPQTWVHFDMMGLAPQEELYYSSSNILSRLSKFCVLRILEFINIRKADSISVVSKRFQNYLVDRYNIRMGKIDVLPYTVDQNQFFYDEDLRQQYRKKYQIKTHEKIILYSGMLQKWQNPDLLFKFLNRIQKQDHENEFRFMILTFDRETASFLSIKHGINKVYIDSVNVETLNGIYNAADICIALRVKNIVSYVSSPVKIPEYLATKNSLVTLTYIGDFGTDLKHKKYALIKQDEDALLSTRIAELQQLKKPDEDDLAEIIEKYSFHKNIALISKVINRENE